VAADGRAGRQKILDKRPGRAHNLADQKPMKSDFIHGTPPDTAPFGGAVAAGRPIFMEGTAP
jgi:hypothetical protein